MLHLSSSYLSSKEATCNLENFLNDYSVFLPNFNKNLFQKKATFVIVNSCDQFI